MSSATIYTSPLCSCIHCREVKSSSGIHSHYLATHGTEEQRNRQNTGTGHGTYSNKTKQQIKKEIRIIEYQTNPSLCLDCGARLSYQKRKDKFCSKSCAAKYNNLLRKPRTLESRSKISAALSGRKNPSAKNPDLHPKWCGIKFHPCKECNKIISNPARLTCSDSCRDAITSKNGTLRRRITYDNKIFQSNWEVAIAKFFNEQQIQWEQPTQRVKWFDTTLLKNRTYLPDFYLPSLGFFVDVKNPFKQEQDKDKLTQLKNIMPLFVGDIEAVKSFVMANAEGLEPPT